MSAVNAGWFGINSLYIDSACDSIDSSLRTGLDGTSYWEHGATETHWFIIDLKRSLTVTNLRGKSLQALDPINVNVYVSDNKADWGTAVAANITTWQDTSAWVEITPTEKKGRYVKVEITDTEHIDDFIRWGSSGMFDVYCTDIPDKFAIPINLMDGEFNTSSTSYVDCGFRIPWDGSKFATIEAAYITANGQITGEGSGRAELYDFTNSASLGETVLATYGANNHSPNMSMPAGAALLGVRLKMISGTLITLRGATLHIILAAPENGGTIKARLINSVGYIATSFTTDYTEGECKRWLYTAANYDGTISASFGAYMKSVTGWFFTNLYDRTSDYQETELIQYDAGTAYNSAAITLIDGDEYTSQNHLEPDVVGPSGAVYGAHIILDISGFTKFECNLVIANDGATSTNFSTNSYVASSHTARYDGSKIGTAVTEYVESCAKMSGTGETGSTKMYDDGSEITNSLNEFTAASFARVRGGSSITEPAWASRLELYGKGYVTTSKSCQVYVQRLIILVTGFDTTPSTVTAINLRTLMGVGT